MAAKILLEKKKKGKTSKFDTSMSRRTMFKRGSPTSHYAPKSWNKDSIFQRLKLPTYHLKLFPKTLIFASQVVNLAKNIALFTIFRALYMQYIYTICTGKKFRPLHISSRTSLLELCNTNFSRFSLVKKCRVGHYWCWHNHLAEGWNCEIRTKLQTHWSVCKQLGF